MRTSHIYVLVSATRQNQAGNTLALTCGEPPRPLPPVVLSRLLEGSYSTRPTRSGYAKTKRSFTTSGFSAQTHAMTSKNQARIIKQPLQHRGDTTTSQCRPTNISRTYSYSSSKTAVRRCTRKEGWNRTSMGVVVCCFTRRLSATPLPHRALPPTLPTRRLLATAVAAAPPRLTWRWLVTTTNAATAVGIPRTTPPISVTVESQPLHLLQRLRINPHAPETSDHR